MYDILGIKSVIMEEMCERTDSEKKEIREIKEIMSSKEKFLNSVDSVVFVFKKIVGDSGNVNYLDFGEIPNFFYISSGYIMFCLIILDIWRFDTNEP